MEGEKATDSKAKQGEMDGRRITVRDKEEDKPPATEKKRQSIQKPSEVVRGRRD